MNTNEPYETLYARYRKAAGLTQEYAAELLGVAPRTLQAWERGESTPPNARVLSMCDIYTAPTLAIEHLRMTNIIAYDALPPVKVVPVAQAVCSLLSAIRRLEDIHAGDQLLTIAADGRIDELERADYDQLLIELEPVIGAVLSLKYAKEG
ncbi:MAG: helix-turn-helix transcriptional regulator [Firmicutes bacterium]|nr:helix-turn-helix transcriptional regulator [Bacillota bacterium]